MECRQFDAILEFIASGQQVSIIQIENRTGIDHAIVRLGIERIQHYSPGLLFTNRGSSGHEYVRVPKENINEVNRILADGGYCKVVIEPQHTAIRVAKEEDDRRKAVEERSWTAAEEGVRVAKEQAAKADTRSKRANRIALFAAIVAVATLLWEVISKSS